MHNLTEPFRYAKLDVAIPGAMSAIIRPFDIRLKIPRDTLISRIDTSIKIIGKSGDATDENVERIISMTTLKLFLQDCMPFQGEIEISFDDYAYMVLPIMNEAFKGTEQ